MNVKEIFKIAKRQILENYIEKDYIYKEKKKLEKEREGIVKQKSDRVYDNYKKDEILRIINIKIETLSDILKNSEK